MKTLCVAVKKKKKNTQILSTEMQIMWRLLNLIEW